MKNKLHIMLVLTGVLYTSTIIPAEPPRKRKADESEQEGKKQRAEPGSALSLSAAASGQGMEQAAAQPARESTPEEKQNLVDAIENDNREVVITHLNNFPSDINLFDKKHRTLLMTAIEANSPEAFQEILQRTSNEKIEERDNDGETALLIAAGNDNPIFTKELLQRGANSNVKIEDDLEVGDENYEGSTPLMIASRNANLEIIQLLLQHGADINAANTRLDNNTTAYFIQGVHDELPFLHYLDLFQDENVRWPSLIKNQVAVLNLLIENGSDIHARSSSGDSMLMVAATLGAFEVVKKLVEAGVDIMAADYGNTSAIDNAKDQLKRLSAIPPEKRSENYEELVSSYNKIITFLSNPLHYARDVFTQQEPHALLFEQKIYPCAQFAQPGVSQSPEKTLLKAAQSGIYDCVVALVEKGVNIMATDNDSHLDDDLEAEKGNLAIDLAKKELKKLIDTLPEERSKDYQDKVYAYKKIITFLSNPLDYARRLSAKYHLIGHNLPKVLTHIVGQYLTGPDKASEAFSNDIKRILQAYITPEKPRYIYEDELTEIVQPDATSMLIELMDNYSPSALLDSDKNGDTPILLTIKSQEPIALEIMLQHLVKYFDDTIANIDDSIKEKQKAIQSMREKKATAMSEEERNKLVEEIKDFHKVLGTPLDVVKGGLEMARHLDSKHLIEVYNETVNEVISLHEKTIAQLKSTKKELENHKDREFEKAHNLAAQIGNQEIIDLLNHYFPQGNIAMTASSAASSSSAAPIEP
ncbi:MAG: ankyrin repeat domain-containing protein, partial [Candidatus Babeliales bacterium]|nr:ankyrin repeat domain-containing protein [Candidatus Babeliales bacterium]